MSALCGQKPGLVPKVVVRGLPQHLVPVMAAVGYPPGALLGYYAVTGFVMCVGAPAVNGVRVEGVC